MRKRAFITDGESGYDSIKLSHSLIAMSYILLL
ncbi:hypothetical protein ES708_09246 [subsurface metagenome]